MSFNVKNNFELKTDYKLLKRLKENRNYDKSSIMIFKKNFY